MSCSGTSLSSGLFYAKLLNVVSNLAKSPHCPWVVENGDPDVNNNPDLIYPITWLKLAKHAKARNTRFY